MASRTTDLYARIVGDSSSYEKALGKAKEGTRQFERELARLERERKAAMGQVGRVAAVTGAAILAGVGLSVRAAVKWESAWAGVTKTVNGSKEQMAALEGGLRDLARTLPASHEEIAKVAESAGQLGVKRKDILSFTKTMIDMGVSTDLTADQAATSMARFANIMGTPTRQIGKLGATIVNLGNKGASTESEILEMGLRIAGAGRQIGLSEGEVLGFANALSSVGIKAEAGGSAISRVFVTMSQAVEKGGNDLDTFARVAGMSADQFKQKFQKDAAGATVAFITGLGQMNKTGKSTFGTLNQLGFSGIRVRDTLLRASNASDVFAKSIHDGNTAWRDGSALIKEANKRYATTESRLRIARNRLDDFAITMGETFLPVIGGAADTLGGFLDVLNGMPKPAKQALGILGGISGVVLGIGGAALIAVPKIQDFTDSLRTMGRRGTAVANGLSRVGTVLTGPWGIAIAAGITAIAIFTKKKADAAAEVRDFTRAMIQDGDAIGGNTRVLAAHKLEEIGALERAQDLGISVSDYTDAVLGNKDALERVNGALEKNGKVYVAARYGAEGGAKATRQFSAEGKFLDETLRGMNGTVNEAVKGARRESAAARDGAGAAKKHGRSVQGEANAMDRAQISAQDLKNALDRLNGRTLNMRQSERAFQQAVDDARKALHRNGKTLDIHTQKGRDNQQQLDHIAQSTLDLVDSEKKNDASNKQLRKTMERGRKKLIQTAKQMGMTRDEAKKLADKILAVPDKLKVPTSAPGANKSKNEMDHLHDAMRRIDNRDVHVKVKVRGADAVAHAVVKIKGHGVATGRYATGGEIVGPGSATSDSVLIRASRGEHMLSAREVRGFGGHGAVKQLRASARTAPGYAAGGPVRVHASTRGVEGMIHRLERLNRSIGYAAGKMGDFAERRLSMSFGFGGGGSAVSAHGPVVDIVRRTAAQFGWGSGAQWNALKWLIMHESGFRPTAQNPTSSAYGLFQFLDGTWGTVGGHKTSNPALQSLYGMRYVGSRYGSPLGAQSFWQGHHWYDNGGVLKPGATMAINRTGRDEVVLSPAQAKALGAQAPPVVISGPMVLEVDGRQFDAYLHSRQDKHDRGLRQRARAGAGVAT